MAQISSCCRAIVKVVGAAEGTNYYVCTKCGKPCDATVSPDQMTCAQLHELFRTHRGESIRLARELKLSPTTISGWFRGYVNSARIKAAVLLRAEELAKKSIASARAKAEIHRELDELYSAVTD